MSEPIPQQKVLNYSFPHGEVQGRLILPSSAQTVVVITNGHNGFYSYGMFPWLQDRLAEAGYASFSYNFSHGGIKGEEDVFSDLEGYARNCMRLEMEDLVCSVKALRAEFPHLQCWLLAHSMGAIPASFGAGILLSEGVPLAGLILLAPVSRLDFWPRELISEWSRTGTIAMHNRRTGQDLPHGPELLAEILSADQDWNMEWLFTQLHLPLTIIHGAEDESVPIQHGQCLARRAMVSVGRTRFVCLGGAGHTFGTRHPFDGPARTTKDMLHQVLFSLGKK